MLWRSSSAARANTMEEIFQVRQISSSVKKNPNYRKYCHREMLIPSAENFDDRESSLPVAGK
jgi:hypothetical protein